MHVPLNTKLERALLCNDHLGYSADGRSLLHAYIACLSLDELSAAILGAIADRQQLCRPLRRRLLRALKEDKSQRSAEVVVELIGSAWRLSEEHKKLRPAVDALCETLFHELPSPTQKFIIEGWIDRGTRAAACRWLNVISHDTTLFNQEDVASYWRAKHDARAAKSLALHADANFLSEILPELAMHCMEGWIVSRAALRVSVLPDAAWSLIRERHPATYLYLCAKKQIPVTDDEAVQLVHSCGRDVPDDSRWLAIWAVGEMGKYKVLDSIARSIAKLYEFEWPNDQGGGL